jgi:hypothetical protein
MSSAERNALYNLVKGPNGRGSVKAVVSVLLELRIFCRDRSFFPILEGTPDKLARPQWAMDRLTAWLESIPSWAELTRRPPR